MKLTNDQIKFLEDNEIELILREMEVRDFSNQEWIKRLIVFRNSHGFHIDQSGTYWTYAQETVKFELTREKVLEEAKRKDAVKREEIAIEFKDSTHVLTKDAFDELVAACQDEDDPVGKIDTRDTADAMSYALTGDHLNNVRNPPINYDEHYSQKEIEPIDVIEETEKRLYEANVDPIKSGNVVRALKYILRAGLKQGEDANKDIRKAANYLHRAETGRWL